MTDRKNPGVAFWASVAVVVLVLYVASTGPAVWLYYKLGRHSKVSPFEQAGRRLRFGGSASTPTVAESATYRAAISDSLSTLTDLSIIALGNVNRCKAGSPSEIERMHPAIWLGTVMMVLGQAAADQSETELKDVLFPFYGREAAEYEFFLDAAHEKKLQLQKQPVLTWTNADRYMGSVFVWTYGGRPEMIGCIGSHQNRPTSSNVFHEFHSLSPQAIEPVRFGHGTKTWTPTRPWLEPVVVDGAPVPADSERLRLTQMRNLAREFNGSMKDNNDVTELRLLPQPIIRYKAPERGVIDGAIFALVWKGTDPEILVILEDRQDDAVNRWHYALARFNYREMWVKRNDREVWRVGVSSQNGAYITGMVGATTHDEMRAKASTADDLAK